MDIDEKRRRDLRRSGMLDPEPDPTPKRWRQLGWGVWGGLAALLVLAMLVVLGMLNAAGVLDWT